MGSENSNYTARQFLEMLFDAESIKETGRTALSGEKPVGVVTAYGTVDGVAVYAFCQDISASSGKVDKAHSTKIEKLYELALKTGSPVVGIYNSKGGNLLEGVAVMDAYSRINSHIAAASGVVPQISVILGNCGGAMAMAACNADMVIMSKKAKLFAVPPLVSDSGELADEAYASGTVSVLAQDEQSAILSARQALMFFPKNNLEQPPIFEYLANDGCKALANDFSDAFECARLAVDCESRLLVYSGYAKNCETAFATIGGAAVGTIALSGNIGENECEKSVGLIKICDCFNIPILIFMNCEGLDTNGSASMLLKQCARLSQAMSEATTSKVFVAVGKAYGTPYVAFAGSADLKLAFPNAVISPVMPQTAVAILADDQVSKDKPRETVIEEFIANNLSAQRLAETGIIDDIILPCNLRDEMTVTVDMLFDKRVLTLPKKHSCGR